MITKPTALGLAGALVVLAAIALHYSTDDDPVVEVNSEVEKPSNSLGSGSGSKNGQTAEKLNSVAPSGTPVDKRDVKASLVILPEFDVVRIDPDGNMVIAGRAKPDATIQILDGERILGIVKADGRGEWVYVPDVSLKPGSRIITLKDITDKENEVASLNAIVLVVPEPGRNIAGSGTTNSKPLAMIVPRDQASSAATRLIQTPGLGDATSSKGSAELAESRVSQEDREQRSLILNTIDYDEIGSFLFSGYASPGAVLYIYIDDFLVGTVQSEANGTWKFQIKRKMTAGEYQIRIDRLEKSGKVIERIQIPFKKMPAIDGTNDKRIVIIQPGNSLWRIAARVYGSGFRYTEIYKANAGQIRDPDLIYPGQVFKLPEVD